MPTDSMLQPASRTVLHAHLPQARTERPARRRVAGRRPALLAGRLSALCLAAALLLAAGPARAKPVHGVALGGTAKYPAGFTHFDYANPKAPKGGSLTLASLANFDTLNPFSLKGVPAPQLDLVFETLMVGAMDEPFSMYGLLAKSIDVAADGLSVTFELDPRATFSDGRPVTAQDVAFSMQVLRSPAARPQYRFYYADVKGVDVLNKRRVRFRFARKNRELALISGQLPVLPRHVYAGKDFGRDFVALAVGSGPYRVASADPGKQVRYERREDYWGRDLPVNAGRDNFDRITVKIFRDQTVQLEALKAGDFDFFPVSSSKQWAVNVGGEKWDRGWLVKEMLRHHNTAGMQGFVFNTRRPIFADRQVRKALALALDFQWSNENLFYGQYTASASYFDNSELAARGLPSPAELKLLEPVRKHLPPEVFTQPMGKPLGAGLSTRQRLREAKRILNAAGWAVKDGVLTETATGRPMRFTVTLVSPAFERITEPYLDNLRRLGVRATMKVVDLSVYEGLVRTFDFDMIVGSYGQSQSPGNEQRYYWHSATAEQEGAPNYAGVRSPAVDHLVEAVIGARSRNALVTAVHALDRALWYGYYVVPQWYIDAHRVTYWNKFGRPGTLPLYYGPDAFLMYWWVDPARAEALRKAVAAGKPLVLPR